MHVSGHGMVKWVQRYACAKLSETIWLAGGLVFHGGDLYSRQYKHVLDEYNTETSKETPFSNLHIRLHGKFEGSRTFTSFTAPKKTN